MYTRKQRLDNECSHREYFRQFVCESLVQAVAHSIGENKLMGSKDEHLNDIPLARWDALDGLTRRSAQRSAQEIGLTGWSLSDSVCTAKEAARQYIEQQGAL